MIQTNELESRIEAGLDEVGRGCIAGPVVAAAVILAPNTQIIGLADSKTLDAKIRARLSDEIKDKAIAWAIAEVDNLTIDKINILNASIMAMHLATDKLLVRPEFLAVDGNRFKPYQNIPHLCIIKGDGKIASIAAASVIAKHYRDQLMAQLAQKYPGYGWEHNAGYPTPYHKKALLQLGTTSLHRKSYKTIKNILSLFDE